MIKHLGKLNGTFYVSEKEMNSEFFFFKRYLGGCDFEGNNLIEKYFFKVI